MAKAKKKKFAAKALAPKAKDAATKPSARKTTSGRGKCATQGTENENHCSVTTVPMSVDDSSVSASATTSPFPTPDAREAELVMLRREYFSFFCAHLTNVLLLLSS